MTSQKEQLLHHLHLKEMKVTLETEFHCQMNQHGQVPVKVNIAYVTLVKFMSHLQMVLARLCHCFIQKYRKFFQGAEGVLKTSMKQYSFHLRNYLP